MSNEIRHQSPADSVMEWAVEKEKGFPSMGIGRNDDCPCGSGEIFKSVAEVKED